MTKQIWIKMVKETLAMMGYTQDKAGMLTMLEEHQGKILERYKPLFNSVWSYNRDVFVNLSWEAHYNIQVLNKGV